MVDGQSGKLFAAIRHGKVKPGMAAEFAKRVEARALPVMNEATDGEVLVGGSA